MEEETNCRRRSSLPEGKPAHFFKIILPTTILDKKLRVPKTFVNHHGDDFSPIITLRDPSGQEWKIGLEKSEDDDDLWFSEGWDKFMEHYYITNEHFIVFKYEGYSRFHVLIFDMTGSEIQYPSQNLIPERNQVASSESSQSNGRDHHWSQNHSDNDNDYDNGSANDDEEDGIGHHFTEEYFPDDEDDSTHAFEEDNSYYSTSPSQSTTPTKRQSFTKFIDRAPERERRKLYSPPPPPSKRKRREPSSSASESDEQSDRGSRSRGRRRRRRRSAEGRSRERVKKADNLEWVRKQTLKSKSYKKRHIPDRARAKVIEAADNYRSRFPSFRAILRPYNLYNSLVYVPARFGVKYMGGGSEKIILENVKGKQWEARCFNRNGSGNGMNIGEGWGKFRVDNEVKEGDVCVFELVRRKAIVVLRVRIFRAKQYV